MSIMSEPSGEKKTLCQFCKEEIAEGSIKCKQCASRLVSVDTHPPPPNSDIETKQDIHKLIDTLDMSDGLKAKMHFVHDHLVEIKYGFPGYDGKNGTPRAPFNIWAFLFSILYYFVKGLWRKAIVIILLQCVVSAITMAISPEIGYLSWVFSPVVAALCLDSDIYRQKVLKQYFWW